MLTCPDLSTIPPDIRELVRLDRATVAAQLEPLVTRLDGDPAHELGAEHPLALALDADPVGDRLLELGRERLDERVEVAAIGSQRGCDQVDVEGPG